MDACTSNSNNADTDKEEAKAMYTSIATNDDPNIFYKSQQIGEAELNSSQKISILKDLFEQRPRLFLERYVDFIGAEFVPLFNEADSSQKFYLDQIRKRDLSKSNLLIRNRRYLAMQELRAKGSYFSNEKMREREPYLFDLMVGQYLNEEEKFHLRPTIEIDDSNFSEFTKLLEQLDNSQRVADRRERFLENYRQIMADSDRTDRFMNHVSHRTVEAEEEEQRMEAEFQMEFDSSDEEGREAEQQRQRAFADQQTMKNKKRHIATNDDTFVMRRFRDKMDKLAQKEAEKKQKPCSSQEEEEDKAVESLSGIQISKKSVDSQQQQQQEEEEEEWSSGDEDEAQPTGFSREQLYEEFVSMMELRFLEGRDAQFFDYKCVDAGLQKEADSVNKIRDQDMEDAYFDSEEAD